MSCIVITGVARQRLVQPRSEKVHDDDHNAGLSSDHLLKVFVLALPKRYAHQSLQTFQ
jgi:hypothetical protein